MFDANKTLKKKISAIHAINKKEIFLYGNSG